MVFGPWGILEGLVFLLGFGFLSSFLLGLQLGLLLGLLLAGRWSLTGGGHGVLETRTGWWWALDSLVFDAVVQRRQ